MPKIASISGVMVGVVAMALMFAPALAAEEPPAGETAAPPIRPDRPRAMSATTKR